MITIDPVPIIKVLKAGHTVRTAMQAVASVSTPIPTKLLCRLIRLQAAAYATRSPEHDNLRRRTIELHDSLLNQPSWLPPEFVNEITLRETLNARHWLGPNPPSPTLAIWDIVDLIADVTNEEGTHHSKLWETVRNVHNQGTTQLILAAAHELNQVGYQNYDFYAYATTDVLVELEVILEPHLSEADIDLVIENHAAQPAEFTYTTFLNYHLDASRVAATLNLELRPFMGQDTVDILFATAPVL